MANTATITPTTSKVTNTQSPAAASLSFCGMTCSVWVVVETKGYVGSTSAEQGWVYEATPYLYYHYSGTANQNCTITWTISGDRDGNQFSAKSITKTFEKGKTYSSGDLFIGGQAYYWKVHGSAYGNSPTYKVYPHLAIEGKDNGPGGATIDLPKTGTTYTLTFQDLKRTWNFLYNGNKYGVRTGYFKESITTPAAPPTPAAEQGTTSATITFDGNGGTASPTSTSLTLPTEATYSFGGWGAYKASTVYAMDFSTGERNSTATFTKGNPKVTQGQRVSLASATRTGYNFTGWYNGNTYEGKSGYSATAFKSAATLTAHWEAQSCSYEVYYKGPGGEDLRPPEMGTKGYGSKLTKNAPTINGYAPDAATKSITMQLSGNTITFYYSLVNNKITYDVGTYGVLNSPIASYNIQSGTPNPATGERYIVLPVPTIKSEFSQWSFIGWTWEGHSTPTSEVIIWVERETYDGRTTNYVANYERVSKWIKGDAGVWRPIMNTYVKAIKDGREQWCLVPKGQSQIKKSSNTWVRERLFD